MTKRGVLITTTATSLARQVGVDPSTAWRWLQGYAEPSALALAKLRTLGVQLELPPKRPRPAPKRQRGAMPGTPEELQAG